MVNAMRGEVRVTIGPQEFVLRPKLETFQAIRAETGLGDYKVAQLLEEGSVSVAVSVLYASGVPLKRDQIFDLIMEHGGMRDLSLALCGFVLQAFLGLRRAIEATAPAGVTAEAPEAPEGDGSKRA